jgi:hypothetical protein
LSGDSLNISFNSQLVLSTAGKTKIYVFVDAADDNLNDDTFYFETVVLPAPGKPMINIIIIQTYLY